MKTHQLTPKQAAFVAEYLLDLNATQAAIRAGYSERTAYRTGADNLRKPQIARAIEAAQADRAERLELTADDVLAGLHQEATRDGIDSSHSARVAAWAHIGKHLGMFTDRVEAKHSFDGVIGIRVNLPKGEDDAA